MRGQASAMRRRRYGARFALEGEHALLWLARGERLVMAKVMLLAYACDRDDVSETWCSYQWTSRLVRQHEATVLVCNRRSRLGAAREQLPGARVFEWAEPALLERFGTFSSMVKPAYLSYYWRARRLLRRLLRQESFDLIHQYEPFAPRYPSPAVGLGVPFILGPVGGAVDTPPGFAAETERHMAWYTQLRAVDRWRFRYDPWLRRTYAGADLVLGIAPYVAELLAPVPVRRIAFMHETGVEAVPPAVTRRRPERGHLRLLFVGRVVRTKGVRDAVRAMAHLRDLPGVTLDVLGDGDDRQPCEAEAATLGVTDTVTFHRWQDRDVVARYYAGADVFVFPSFREASGTVVIEAMSNGLPLVVAASGGPGYTIGDTCGIAVPPEAPAQFAAGIAAAVRRLAADPDLVLRLGRAARERVATDFLWDRKVERMGEIYREVIATAAARRAQPVVPTVGVTAASAAHARRGL